VGAAVGSDVAGLAVGLAVGLTVGLAVGLAVGPDVVGSLVVGTSLGLEFCGGKDRILPVRLRERTRPKGSERRVTL
jgi:hypothetical protein